MEVVVDGSVVDLAEHGSGLGPLIAVLEDEGDEGLDERLGVLLHHIGRRHDQLDVLKLGLGLLAEVSIRRGVSISIHFSCGSLALALRCCLLLEDHHLAHGVVHWSCLVVEVLDAAQRQPGDVGIVLNAHQVVCAHGGKRQENRLVLQPLQVLVGVRVCDLEGLEHLVIQALHEGHKVALHLDSALSVRWGLLLEHREFAAVDNGDVSVLLQDLQDFEKKLHAAPPKGDCHMGGHGGVEVEKRAHNLHENFYLLAGPLGNG
mmetsp:Transcript_31530/g.89532  ORF Transcript_31530/g.89532 Transcript_31530/m.89532 type:complete len:261 (+) Transcript_31530:1460-2242(+)